MLDNYNKNIDLMEIQNKFDLLFHILPLTRLPDLLAILLE
jgi:hypothetical protein